jgi:5-methylcytosine-specific restriction endonuclease McrA
MPLKGRFRVIEDAIEASGRANTTERQWLESEVRAWVRYGRGPLKFEDWRVHDDSLGIEEIPIGPPAAPIQPAPLPRAFTNKVLAKIRDAVVPTVAERRKAERDYATKGARAVERNARGNEYDRHASQKRLLAEFSLDGGKTCPCVYCGVLLTWKEVTRERIHAGSAGGRYRHDNLLPACSFCNKSRGDRDIRAALQRRWGRRVRLR